MDMGKRGGEGECGKSNMETDITICKIDSQWEFAVWLRKLILCNTLEGWYGREMGGRFKREGMYVNLPESSSSSQGFNLKG